MPGELIVCIIKYSFKYKDITNTPYLKLMCKFN